MSPLIAKLFPLLIAKLFPQLFPLIAKQRGRSALEDAQICIGLSDLMSRA